MNVLKEYEPTYPEVFQLLRDAGWTPELQSRPTADGYTCWAAAPGAWGLHSFSLDFADELEKRTIVFAPREVRFSPGLAFETMRDAVHKWDDITPALPRNQKRFLELS